MPKNIIYLMKNYYQLLYWFRQQKPTLVDLKNLIKIRNTTGENIEKSYNVV